MPKRIDYDRAFAGWKILRSVQRHVDILKLEHPDYRIAATSPFLIYPSGGLYCEPVSNACLMAYWRITDQFLLESEIDGLATRALRGAIDQEILRLLDGRCKTFYPWLTEIGKAADRTILKHLKRNHLLN